MSRCLALLFVLFSAAPAAARPRRAGATKVTVVQIRLTTPVAVLAAMKRAFEQNKQSELFVFPEFSTHGDRIDLAKVRYLRGDAKSRATAEKWIKLTPRFGQLKALADRFRKAVIVGCLEQAKGKLYSRAYFYDPRGSQLAHYDKTHVHWTEKFLRPGNRLVPIRTRFGRIGVLICYDLAFVEPTRVLSLEGAEVLVVVSAIPEHFHWKYPLRRVVGAAIFNQYPVVAATLGKSRAAPMGGHSMIADAEGDLIAHKKDAGAGTIGATIDLAAMRRWRRKEVITPHRRPSLYKRLAR